MVPVAFVNVSREMVEEGISRTPVVLSKVRPAFPVSVELADQNARYVEVLFPVTVPDPPVEEIVIPPDEVTIEIPELAVMVFTLYTPPEVPIKICPAVGTVEVPVPP